MDPAHAHVDPAVPPAADATAQAAGHAASAASGTTSEPAMAAENPDAAPVAPQGQGGDPRVPPSAAHPPPAPGAGAGGMAGGEGVGVGGGVGVPVIAPGGGPAGFPLEKTLTSHQRWVWDACFSADSAYLVTVSGAAVPPTPPPAGLWSAAPPVPYSAAPRLTLLPPTAHSTHLRPRATSQRSSGTCRRAR